MLTSGMPSAVLPAKVVVVTRQSNCHLIQGLSIAETRQRVDYYGGQYGQVAQDK
jgi:hypothetical protein